MLGAILLIILALLLIGALAAWPSAGAGVAKNRTATGRMPSLLSGGGRPHDRPACQGGPRTCRCLRPLFPKHHLHLGLRAEAGGAAQPSA